MAERNLTEKESLILLNYMIISGVHMDAAYALKDTSIYKHELKLKVNQVNNILRKYNDDLQLLCNASEQQFEAVIENCSELCQPLINGVTPENWQMLTFMKNAIMNEDKNKEAIEEMKKVIEKYLI